MNKREHIQHRKMPSPTHYFIFLDTMDSCRIPVSHQKIPGTCGSTSTVFHSSVPVSPLLGKYLSQEHLSTMRTQQESISHQVTNSDSKTHDTMACAQSVTAKWHYSVEYFAYLKSRAMMVFCESYKSFSRVICNAQLGFDRTCITAHQYSYTCLKGGWRKESSV